MLEAARAIGLRTNLADMIMLEAITVRATVVPLVTLLDSDKRVAPAVGAHLEVVQVGRDRRDLHEPLGVVGTGAV